MYLFNACNIQYMDVTILLLDNNFVFFSFLAIPAWSIGVIVAGAVLLVFVFGGCGLYYGIKRNKKGGADFDSPHPSVDE